MDKLLEILNAIRPDVDFLTEKGLIDNSILDSFAIVQIVGDVEEKFKIQINPADITPENFNSAEMIYALIEKVKH